MSGKRIRSPRSIDTKLSRRALAELLAAEAGATHLVQQFRMAVLKGNLLDPSEIVSWVEDHYDRERTAPDRRLAVLGETTAAIHFGPGKELPVWPGGDLDALRIVGEYLAKAYSWELGAATTFVLSGATPNVPGVQVRRIENLKYPRLSRIILEVDPSLTPREVMDTYRDERSRFVKGRMRAIGVKSSELVLFHVQRMSDRLTWQKEMELWNREWKKMPEYQFQRESNYAKRIGEAVRSLLSADYQLWKQGKRKGKR